MNSKVIIGIVVALVVVGAGFYFLRGKSSQMSMPQPTTQTQTTPSEAAAGQNAVTIQNFAFSPATLTVKAGSSVVWTNNDSAGHSATADGGSFDTGVLSTGQSKSITFSKLGTFKYHCSVHPNMHGTIIVE